MGESPVFWQTWSDGAGSIPTIIGDQDWGKLSLDLNDQGRSRVYDFGNSNQRSYTLTENRYGSGQGIATLQIRGDTAIFGQDAVSPSWENYSISINRSWRYVQVREVKET